MDSRKIIATLSKRAAIIKYYADHSDIGRSDIVNITNALFDAENSTDFRMCNSITAKQEHGVIQQNYAKREINFYNISSVDSFVDAKSNDIIMIEPHGLRCVVTYDRGLFVRCRLASFLNYDLDITPLARTFFNIPEKIEIKDRIHILGYLCILKDEFNLINAYSKKDEYYDDSFFMLFNAVKSLNIDVCRNNLISFIVTDYPLSENNKDRMADLLRLDSFGFMVAPFVGVDESSDMNIIVDNMVNLADRFGIPVFGISRITFSGSREIVKKCNTLFESKVVGVSITLDDSGNILPVVEFDEIYTESGNFTKVTLRNISEMCNLNIHLNDKLIMQLDDNNSLKIVYNRNMSDHIYSAFDSYDYLSVCPICGSPIEFIHDESTGKIIGAKCHNHNQDEVGYGLF